uniref:C-type lectin domain-containing protein n=1 Tax=Astyanax mexicanus TaxID=7994 RepID=A0A8B9JAC4_ASTMX
RGGFVFVCFGSLSYGRILILLQDCLVNSRIPFYVVNDNKNWTEAQKYCREKFTDLATIQNQEEVDAVKSALNGASGYFWIGLRQDPEQTIRSWIWSDGSNSSYTDWSDGEPNNAVGDICVQLQSVSGYRWADSGCNCINLPFYVKPCCCAGYSVWLSIVFLKYPRPSL